MNRGVQKSLEDRVGKSSVTYASLVLSTPIHSFIHLGLSFETPETKGVQPVFLSIHRPTSVPRKKNLL